MYILITIILIACFCSIHYLSLNHNKLSSSKIDFYKKYLNDLKTDNYKQNIKPINSNRKKTYIASNGYIRFVDSNKLVHRWIMEKNIGRKLRKEEVVHHIDGNKKNNNIKNLRLFANQKEHHNYHENHLKNYGTWHEIVPSYIKQHSYFS